jgi:hypothetical protein
MIIKYLKRHFVDYRHSTLNAPDLGSKAGVGLVSTWMGDRF